MANYNKKYVDRITKMLRFIDNYTNKRVDVYWAVNKIAKKEIAHY